MEPSKRGVDDSDDHEYKEEEKEEDDRAANVLSKSEWFNRFLEDFVPRYGKQLASNHADCHEIESVIYKQASHDAEATAAAFTMNKKADVVISDDSDNFANGAERVIRVIHKGDGVFQAFDLRRLPIEKQPWTCIFGGIGSDDFLVLAAEYVEYHRKILKGGVEKENFVNECIAGYRHLAPNEPVISRADINPKILWEDIHQVVTGRISNIDVSSHHDITDVIMQLTNSYWGAILSYLQAPVYDELSGRIVPACDFLVGANGLGFSSMYYDKYIKDDFHTFMAMCLQHKDFLYHDRYGRLVGDEVAANNLFIRIVAGKLKPGDVTREYKARSEAAATITPRLGRPHGSGYAMTLMVTRQHIAVTMGFIEKPSGLVRTEKKKVRVDNPHDVELWRANDQD